MPDAAVNWLEARGQVPWSFSDLDGKEWMVKNRGLLLPVPVVVVLPTMLIIAMDSGIESSVSGG